MVTKKMADGLRCLRLSLVLLFCHCFPRHRSEKFIRLEPEKQILNEALHHMESMFYQLTNLNPGSSYELRISYPATTPSEFLIKLVDKKELASTSSGRKLLNIDKIMFTNGFQETEKVAKVTALRVGRPLDPQRLNDPVIYNIVLEKLYLGLTWETWKMGLLIVCSIVLTVKYAVPYVTAFLEHESLRIYKQEN